MSRRFIICLAMMVPLMLAFATGLHAQGLWTLRESSLDSYPAQETVTADIEYLCSEKVAGASSDFARAKLSAQYIAERMGGSGLLPLGEGYSHHFSNEFTGGDNVIGMLEGFSAVQDRKYIIVGTHYDNLGMIEGTLYPGADANISGVAAMLSLADAFRKQRDDHILYGSNIIFVAFDKFMDGRIGSAVFWNDIVEGRYCDPVTGKKINPDSIALMVDIDQIGCTLVPVNKGRKDYLISLGENSLPLRKRGLLEQCNRFYECGLDLCHSYYGSESFTKAFYRLGDRRHFIDAGIPTVMFTSGITDNNNSPEDKPETIDTSVLCKRIILMFRFIEKLM